MNVSLGQEVCILSRRYGSARAEFGFIVTAISPTGQVTVTSATGVKSRFTKQGREIGASRYYGRHLNPNVDECRKRYEREDLHREISARLPRLPERAGVQSYRAALERARVALDEAEQLINRLEEIENDE